MRWKPSAGVRRLAVSRSTLGVFGWTVVVAYLTYEFIDRGNRVWWDRTVLAWLAGVATILVVVVPLIMGVAWVIDRFREGRKS